MEWTNVATPRRLCSAWSVVVQASERGRRQRQSSRMEPAETGHTSTLWSWRVYRKHPEWLRRVCRKHPRRLVLEGVPETSRMTGFGGCTTNILDGFGECAKNTPRAWRVCRKHHAGKFGGVLKTATQAGFPVFQKSEATKIPRRHVAASGRLRRVEANDRPLTTVGSDLLVSSLFWPLRAF